MTLFFVFMIEYFFYRLWSIWCSCSCHLTLGEIGEALKHFKKCLQSEKDITSGQKYLIEASDGLQKAQVVHPDTCYAWTILFLEDNLYSTLPMLNIRLWRAAESWGSASCHLLCLNNFVSWIQSVLYVINVKWYSCMRHQEEASKYTQN